MPEEEEVILFVIIIFRVMMQIANRGSLWVASGLTIQITVLSITKKTLFPNTFKDERETQRFLKMKI